MRHRRLSRAAGVLTPLFSVYSENSAGVGEFGDIPLLVDWCLKTGLGLIQLLPVNDTGFNFRPYDAESSFALELTHVSLLQIAHVDTAAFAGEIRGLRDRFRPAGDFYDTAIKKAKLGVLRKMFAARLPAGENAFRAFVSSEAVWLEPYAKYRILKDRFGGTGWTDWPAEYRDKNPGAMARLEKEAAGELEFYRWVQWQLFLQMSEAKKYAAEKGVRIVGDIPFLVSRDSADVWTYPQYFKLDLSAGAPPDLYFAGGQEWGMPPYNWPEIERHQYDYLARKLKYAEKFYDFFRIDHFIGVFRVWTFRRDLDGEDRRKAAAFDPPEEALWENHGRCIIEAMMNATSMHPCAEDLGDVPKCSAPVLEDYGIPGMEVQRWMRHWETTHEFKKPEEYRENAIAVISTHDTSPLLLWWKEEAGSPEDRQKFWNAAGLQGDYEPEPSQRLVDACFEFIASARSVFSVQLLQDWLAYTGLITQASPEYRINRPGIVDASFWRLRMPLSLEELVRMPGNAKILRLNQKSGRSASK